MALLDWMKSMRHAEPLRATEIRRRLHEARELHTVTVQQRDLVALDAVHDEASAHRWQDLDDTARELDQRIAMLAGALPHAEARERQAAEEAEVAARAKRMQDYEQRTVEAQAWLDDVLTRLPDGETLTRARNLRQQLANDARELAAWSSAVSVRRPLDPLEAIVAAMQHRIARISHARWVRSSPITLGEAESALLKAAIERATELKGKGPHVV
jgi:hypothetical protein